MGPTASADASAGIDFVKLYKFRRNEHLVFSNRRINHYSMIELFTKPKVSLPEVCSSTRSNEN